MPIGYTYILKCSHDTYYTGSTVDLLKRFLQHQAGRGANYTSNRLPVLLFFFEVHNRIDLAFKREKQLQNWSRKKKEALVAKQYEKLHSLAICQNDSHYSNLKKDTSRTPSEAQGKN